jgi:hypothetical protein
MNKVLQLVCGSLLVMAAACEEQPASSGPATATGTAKAPATTTAKSTGATTAATAAPTAAPAAAELEESKNEQMGYTILLPKGAKTERADANGANYTKDTIIINVNPSGVALASPDDVLRGVNTGDGNVEKKTEGDVFVVIVEKKDLPMLNIYAGPKGAKLTAHCMAEPKDKDLAIKICSSLKAIKK